MTSVRTITDIRRVFGYAAQKAIVVRGDVDAVNLAEKLVRDLDKPKSEVVIDIVIMEANSARTRDLAATIANAAGITGSTSRSPSIRARSSRRPQAPEQRRPSAHAFRSRASAN